MNLILDFKQIFILLILFQVKHFLADFPFQTEYMMGKFRWYMNEWFPPLVAHGLVHAAFTFAIAFYFRDAWNALALAIIDLNLHCIMDRVKASSRLLGRFQALSQAEYSNIKSYPPITMSGRQRLRSNKFFWWSLGFDQMFHHLTHYLLIWLILFR